MNGSTSVSNSTTTIARLPSLESYLLGAKQTLRQAIGSRHKITLVIGRDTADLDSIASAVVFAYLRTAQPPPGAWTQVYIPIVNARRSTVANQVVLRRVLAIIGLAPDALIYLDDLVPPGRRGSGLFEDNTRFILVNHNVMPGLLNYSRYVIGCIDHHLDERYVVEDTAPEPRIIGRAGSCTSLVVYYGRKSWSVLDTRDRQGWEAQLAGLALAAILVGTQDLEARSLLSEEDVVAAWYLESKIAIPDETFNRHAFYREIMGSEAYKPLNDSSVASTSTAADSGTGVSSYTEREYGTDSNAPMGDVSVMSQNILSRNASVNGQMFNSARGSIKAGKARAIDEDRSDPAMAEVRAKVRAEEARSDQVRAEYMMHEQERLGHEVTNIQQSRDTEAQKHISPTEMHPAEREPHRQAEDEAIAQRQLVERQRNEHEAEKQRAAEAQRAAEGERAAQSQRRAEARAEELREKESEAEQARQAKLMRQDESTQITASADSGTGAGRFSSESASGFPVVHYPATDSARQEEARIIALRAMAAPTVQTGIPMEKPMSLPPSFQQPHSQPLSMRQPQVQQPSSQEPNMQTQSSEMSQQQNPMQLTNTIPILQPLNFTSNQNQDQAFGGINNPKQLDYAAQVSAGGPVIPSRRTSRTSGPQSPILSSQQSRKSRNSAQYMDAHTLRVEATDPRARDAERGLGEVASYPTQGDSTSSESHYSRSSAETPAQYQPQSTNSQMQQSLPISNSSAAAPAPSVPRIDTATTNSTNTSNNLSNRVSAPGLSYTNFSHTSPPTSPSLKPAGPAISQILADLYAQREVNGNLIGISHSPLSLAQLIAQANDENMRRVSGSRPGSPMSTNATGGFGGARMDGSGGFGKTGSATAFTAAIKHFAMEHKLNLYAIATVFEAPNTDNNDISMSAISPRNTFGPSSTIADLEDRYNNNINNDDIGNDVDNNGRQIQRELLLWVFTPQLAFFIPIFTLVKGAELGLEPWRRSPNSNAGLGLNSALGSVRGNGKERAGAAGDGGYAEGGDASGNGGGMMNVGGAPGDEFKGVGEGIIRAFWQRNADVGGRELERSILEGLELVK